MSEKEQGVPKLLPDKDEVQRFVEWAQRIGCEVVDQVMFFEVNAPTDEAEEKFLRGCRFHPAKAWGRFNIAVHEILAIDVSGA